LFRKIKQFFSRKKSPESLEMWDKLTDDYTGDPEFHPSLNMDTAAMHKMTKSEMKIYLDDLMRRRREAHDKGLWPT